MISQVLTSFGIERNVTSIYNPRTNGLTERFNQTMVNALRKQAETQETNWDKWLPFILLAYRSRIQNTTRYTPYELMFGRKINNLDNWEKTVGDESIEIIRRAAEIRKLHEITLPVVLKNIENAQVSQRKSQDARNNVKDKTLEIDDKVFVRIPKIQGKLDQIYKGPFKIDAVTPKHNYVLRNSKNKLLKGSFPLNKLKPISKEVAKEISDSDEEEQSEIEKIVKTRLRSGKKEYLIKYKDEEKPIWVLENELDTLFELDKFNGKNKEINNINRIKKGKNNRLNKINWFFVCIIWLMMICFGSATSLTGNFSYCKINDLAPIIQTHNLCESDFLPIKNDVQHLFTILAKSNYHTYGNGFKCVVNKIIVTTRKGLFGHLYTWRNVEPIILNQYECQVLVASNKCYGNNMTGGAGHWRFMNEPVTDHYWLQTLDYQINQCNVYKVTILGDQLDKKLFKNAQNNCLPENLHCIVDKSTYIWDKSIVHKCEYARIKEVLLYFENDLAIGNNLLFKIIRKEKHCEIDMFSTTEGLFLVRYDAKNKWPDSLIDISIEHEVMLADLDKKTFNVFQILAKISDKINKKACEIWQNQLNEFTRWKDEFIKIKNSDDKEIILYNNNGILTVPECIMINLINIRIDDKCKRDIAINFKIKNIEINGYLTDNNIIRENSEAIQCNKERYVDTNNEILHKVGRKIKILKSTYKKIIFNQINFQPSRLIIEHELDIETKFDFVKETQWLLEDKSSEIIDNEQIENKSSEFELTMILVEIYQFIKSMKFWIVLIIITLLVLFITIIFIRFGWINKLCLINIFGKIKKLYKRTNTNNNNLEEMNIIHDYEKQTKEETIDKIIDNNNNTNKSSRENSPTEKIQEIIINKQTDIC